MSSKVYVLKTNPESVFTDYQRLLKMAEVSKFRARFSSVVQCVQQQVLRCALASDWWKDARLTRLYIVTVTI